MAEYAEDAGNHKKNLEYGTATLRNSNGESQNIMKNY